MTSNASTAFRSAMVLLHSSLSRSVSMRPASFRKLTKSCSFKSMAAGREVVSTEQAPGAVGPYSQAVKTGDVVFVSGQVGLMPGTKNLAAEDVEGQTEQVMRNLGAVLEAAGSSYEQVVKTTVLLASMSDFQAVNAIYGRYFSENPPARACFAVKELPLGAKVEIEAIAAL